jgi:DNA-directed RNA polymerase II subunit RPB2
MEKAIFWELITKYFELNKYFITRHHLDSYNDFIDHMIPKVILTLNPITIYKYDKDEVTEKHKIEMYIGRRDGNGIYFDHPTIVHEGKSRLMYPNDARLHNLTYASNLSCDVEIVHYNYKKEGETTLLEKVKIGRIPIMLHSKLCYLKGKNNAIIKELGECMYDQGGYFIIDGKEKVVITQERNITNQLFTHKSLDKRFLFESFIRCTSEKDSVFPKKTNFKVYSGEVLEGKRKNVIVVEVPDINTEVPLFVLFRCLGIDSDLEILQCIIGDNFDSDEAHLMIDFLYNTITDGNIIYNKQQALAYLRKYNTYNSEKNVEYVLYNNLFPNIEFDFNKFDKNLNANEFFDDRQKIINTSKAMFLGHLINKLIKVCLNIEQTTDRDNYLFKRVAISGFLLGDVFKDFYNKLRIHARNTLDKLYKKGDWNSREVLNKSVNESNKNEVFDSQIITVGLTDSLKGRWGLKREQLGFVQDLNRISYLSFTSHLRLVASPMDPDIKIRAPHQLNTSQFGIMCPVESPEGASVGLIKNFAVMCHVTFNTRSEQVLKAVTQYFNVIYLENLLRGHSLSPSMVKLMINYTWIGVIHESDAPILVHYLRLLRRNALINVFTSISWNIFGKTINILTEGGRCSRPLLIVDPETNKLKMMTDKKFLGMIKNSKLENWYSFVRGYSVTEDSFSIYDDNYKDPAIVLGLKEKIAGTKSKSWSQMIKALEENASPLEFIDVEEANTSMISMFPTDLEKTIKEGSLSEYTHCELHPSLMFSVYTSTIPSCNHNQAPRNIFSGAQGKQAIGIYATNFRNRIDTLAYTLHYPQKRLVSTRYSNFIKADQLPNGENLIVAISTHLGFNQEDSIIFNKDSIERGMFNITSYKSYISEEHHNEVTKESMKFANPFNIRKEGKDLEIRKYANYTKIDENGFPKLNADIKEGDVIIGKVKTQLDENGNSNLDDAFAIDDSHKFKYSSAVEVADKTLSGVVDKVYVKQKYGSHEREAKIRLRKFKIPELGDKAASTHGQKGVCGLILPSHSLPFTKDGIVPDIIINPHAIPSRMTIGHLIECVLSKCAVMDGVTIDTTPFDGVHMEHFYDRLQKHGFERHGNEILYDGQTGQQMVSDMYIGPTHYHRLKHMVSDKINYRDTGKKIGMTMQPTKGRSNEGGLKIGEMEANALISHGLSSFIKESVIERSDGHNFYVDNRSGKILGINPDLDVFNGHKQISKVEIPYAFKLLMQELETMSIGTQLHVSKLMNIDHEQAFRLEIESGHDYMDDFDEDNILVDNL